jgi:hypothetical protein
VPNTQLKVKADPKTVDGFPDESAELVLTPDALAYYEECDQKRRQNADDVRAEAGDTDFKLGESLRVTWIPSQRADKALLPMFGKGKELQQGYRIARDGLLERLV